MCLHPKLAGFIKESREDGNLTTASQESFSKRLWGQIPGERLPILHTHTRFHTYTCSNSSAVSRSVMSLCDPTDRSLPGSSIHGNLQARILKWAAIPFSRGSS